jgi:hypothetical protein
LIAPKISIGIELGLGIRVTNLTNNETTYERYTLGYDAYTIQDSNTNVLSLDNFNGGLKVFFRF